MIIVTSAKVFVVFAAHVVSYELKKNSSYAT